MTTSIDSLTDIKQDVIQRYGAVRRATLQLAEPLSPEDCTTQSMPDASPTKWHLGHTSWFFERLILEPTLPSYRRFDSAFYVIFNSYYNTLGEQHPRPRRGVLSRPSLDHVLAYRDYVDQGIVRLLEDDRLVSPDLVQTINLGLQHEQQHQELLLMDIKHLFSCNPLKPAYSDGLAVVDASAHSLDWARFSEGLRQIGCDVSEHRFAFDNETPRHRVFVEEFDIARRLTTNREFLAFIEAGGYETPELWLSDGWAAVQSERWRGPLYWERVGSGWREFTLGGLRTLELDAPVCHVSYFEADAFARWAGARLPTEAEWEVASEGVGIDGNFVEDKYLHPVGMQQAPDRMAQIFGDVWEWTKSGYEPYPGYQVPSGPLGEYNSKFMCSQLVLRGGSCITPQAHIRNTYRNFFPPHTRWQFSGVRLARDVV